MIGSTSWRWIPRLIDSFIPFFLVITQFLLIYSIFGPVYIWCYFMSLYCFNGFLAFYNMFDNAKKHIENQNLFLILDNLPKLTLILTMVSGLTFIGLGIISQIYQSNEFIQQIIAVISTIMIIGFIYRGNIYWSRVTDKIHEIEELEFLK